MTKYIEICVDMIDAIIMEDIQLADGEYLMGDYHEKNKLLPFLWKRACELGIAVCCGSRCTK